MIYLKFALVALVLLLLSAVYYLNMELGERDLMLQQANSALEHVGQAKVRSEKAQENLSKQINELAAATNETIIQGVVTKPVTEEETCMSPVLRGVLEDKK